MKQQSKEISLQLTLKVGGVTIESSLTLMKSS